MKMFLHTCKMNQFLRDFISEEPRKFKFKIGKLLASPLSGLVAGVISASILFLAVGWFIKLLEK